MFFVLLFSIFSFSLANKAQAQCLPGYTMLVKTNSPSECILTQVYNQLHNPSTTINPSAVNPDADGTYTPLAPLPGIDKPIDFTKECPLGNYLNVVINLTIGLIAVIAMVMIVMGGIEYITSELISSKANAKERITGAIVGLLIALGSYLILNTLNPNLLNLCLDGIPKVEIAIEPLGDSLAGPFSAASSSDLNAANIYCPGSGGTAALARIANSFNSSIQVKYSQNPRNKLVGNTLYTDCSAFVSQIYQCAGLSLPGGTTATMFNSSNAINSPNYQRTLQVGDLLGWKAGQSSRYDAGHVVMYIGNNQFIEVNSSGIQVRNISSYSDSYKYHIQAP